MTADIRAYYLSTQAYRGLVTLGQKYGYIKYGSSKVKGISNFLNELVNTNFVDNRPAIVRERHTWEIKNNRAPRWSNSNSRKAYPLQLSEHTLACYIKLAFQFEIIRAEPYAIGGPNRRTPYPTVAYVLEGIGLNWIVPEGITHATEQ